jgi:hypothetical protein
VHLVDPGIDTGEVLYQVRMRPSGEDDYATFSYLQLRRRCRSSCAPPRMRSRGP